MKKSFSLFVFGTILVVLTLSFGIPSTVSAAPGFTDAQCTAAGGQRHALCTAATTPGKLNNSGPLINAGCNTTGLRCCTAAAVAPIACIAAPPATAAPTSTTGPRLDNYQLLEYIPGSQNKVGSFKTYLEDIYKFAFWTVGIAVVLMLTVGGFMYMTSAGNTSRIGTAKTVITDALLGLVLALMAWLFLYVINPDLVNLTLPTSLNVTGGAATGVGTTPATPVAGAGMTAAQCLAASGVYSSSAASCPDADPSFVSIGPHVNDAGEVNGVCCALPSVAMSAAGRIAAGGSGITLSGAGSCSSATGVVSPRFSIQQAAAGTPVTACKNGCPGTGLCTRTTTLSDGLLNGMLTVALTYPFTVSSFTGGSHCEAGLPNCAGLSSHYTGRAVDIIPSLPKSQWPSIVAAFISAGSTGAQTFCDKGGLRVDCTLADHIHIAY